MKVNSLDLHASKVVAALVYMGCYDFVLNKLEDRVQIINLPSSTPFTKILVYADGIIHYYQGGSLSYEGCTKRRTTIINDIKHE